MAIEAARPNSATSPPTGGAHRSELSGDDHAKLVEALQELSSLRDLEGVMAVVRRWARELSRADGVTFVLRDGDQCYYADEDAIAPLWKGRRFPAQTCVSGWAMLHRTQVVIPDIYDDPRVPGDAYRPTFVKSLAMVPVRQEDPIGAIGAYWATSHEATAREMLLLQTLANATSVALANTELYGKAAEAIRIRDEFMAVASHELRTPLTALQLQIQGLRELEPSKVPAERLARRLEGANRQVARLTNLVEQLLDASYLGSGRIALNPEPFDLAELVHETVDRFRSTARRVRCELVVRAPADLPSVCWDRIRIDQALESVLSNALKYGQGKPVEIHVERQGDTIQIAVVDQGIGLDPKDSERIFGRFERAVTSRHYGGLGLGLHIAQQIVLAHGGIMRVQSEPARGATFTIAIPVGSG